MKQKTKTNKLKATLRLLTFKAHETKTGNAARAFPEDVGFWYFSVPLKIRPPTLLTPQWDGLGGPLYRPRSNRPPRVPQGHEMTSPFTSLSHPGTTPRPPTTPARRRTSPSDSVATPLQAPTGATPVRLTTVLPQAVGRPSSPDPTPPSSVCKEFIPEDLVSGRRPDVLRRKGVTDI